MTDFSEDEDVLIIGAGAAPWTYLKRNAEVKYWCICFGHGLCLIMTPAYPFKNKVNH